LSLGLYIPDPEFDVLGIVFLVKFHIRTQPEITTLRALAGNKGDQFMFPELEVAYI